jgi:Yip1-like protein
LSDLQSQARQAYTKYKFSDMISQSIDVLTHPSVATFEKYEKQGDVQQSLIYVGAASIIAGLVAFVFGIFSGFGWALYGLVLGIVSTLVSFYVFAWLIHYVGKTQGGTGTQPEVFYTVALYTAPLRAIVGAVSAIPIINILALPVNLVLSIYQLYLAYLSARASMNLEQTPAIITVVVAVVAMIIAGAIVAAILGAVFAGVLITSGAFR